ncbi:hypothetical protein [Rhodanobacter sp. C05]|uniref:hypothetical protein n=1 Tax=Rhodanobacter sp. C05 TaxID=1945855 RepID=UPI000984D943|nr:hypothetical protein [Rhodanobacter sp. C05]OOG39143.1 hypothetical protein B0E51_11270 [Rhodanobacter sp. C05]
MTRTLFRFVPLGLLLVTSTATAGWYEVKNYVGTIGNLPVHVSLQTFDSINHGEPSQWHVDGGYYYDAHRTPIPLQGKRQPDGHMTLCEAAAPLSSAESPIVPTRSAAHPVPCPISLKIADDGATGEWNDGKKALPITLHQVGSLNDTGDTEHPVTGVVEIPMWYHTKTQLLLGIYESAPDCPASMLHLRLVNIATGHIDNDITLDCQAGMIMTPIYANVSKSSAPHSVTVGFAGGKMGSDEDIDIESHASQGKK